MAKLLAKESLFNGKNGLEQLDKLFDSYELYLLFILTFDDISWHKTFFSDI
jgi:hypothetical protein